MSQKWLLEGGEAWGACATFTRLQPCAIFDIAEHPYHLQSLEDCLHCLLGGADFVYAYASRGSEVQRGSIQIGLASLLPLIPLPLSCWNHGTCGLLL